MKRRDLHFSRSDVRYLSLLAHDFPTIPSVTTEIINLEAILHLPKPTEHFLADLHGEYDAFEHVLRNASGNIRRKAEEALGDEASPEEIRDICALIYYPEERLELVRASGVKMSAFYEETLVRLIAIVRRVSSKYTRSKVRKTLPEEFAYIIEELLHESREDRDKEAYVRVILRTIIGTRRAESFVIALCYLIQRLSIDRLHLLGDIFDRGPGAHLIMDRLEHYHRWDIQWGNHDVLWMGAAAGNACCAAAVVRLSLRYGNTKTLEEGYAINLMPLATFAMETYKDDACEIFLPIAEESGEKTEKEKRLIGQMHKAIAIIELKLAEQLYAAHPEWGMDDRRLLRRLDLAGGTVEIDSKKYAILDKSFPTLTGKEPWRLTEGEQHVVDSLVRSFHIGERLQRHVRALLRHGSMYAIYNSNLLFHASVPLNADGSLRAVEINGKALSGPDLMNAIEQRVRTAFEDDIADEERAAAADYFWYLWCGPNSPLFDKSKMATFERYFIADKEAWHEEKGWYFQLRDEPNVCDAIMDAFDVKGAHRHIINGHVPVRAIRGESPIKADGKLMVIDGGFAKAYHEKTGTAGYTLVYHSRSFELVEHAPFENREEAIREGSDISSRRQIVETIGQRVMVGDTDKGRELKTQIADLEKLLAAYRRGIIRERY